MRKLLLPHQFRYAGFVLTGLGIVANYLRFAAGIKPEVLTVKVFAFYSSILKSVWFKPVYNNISEEICALLLISGLFLIAFSREKYEQEFDDTIRLKSFLVAAYIDTALLIVSILFVFGFGFISIMVAHLISFLVIYTIAFRWLRYAKLKRR